MIVVGCLLFLWLILAGYTIHCIVDEINRLS